MGYIRHQALIANGWSSETVKAAREAVAAAYGQHGDEWCGLVSATIPHIANGGASFFISPDGSKEGWPPSDLGNELREQAKAIISQHQYVDYCEILCGGDDSEFKVLDSPPGTDRP